MGFSCRWLVSLTKGDRQRIMSMQAVSCEILDSKEYRTSKAAFYPPVHSLRKKRAYNEFAKYCNPKVRQD